MTAVAVMLLIVVLVVVAAVALAMYSSEHARVLARDQTIAALRARIADGHPRPAVRPPRAPVPPPRTFTVRVNPPREAPMPPARPPTRALPGRFLAAPILAVLLAIACIPQPPGLRVFTNPTADAAEVVLFGDSLAAMAEPAALALWATNPHVSVSYNATAGTEATDWMAPMDDVDAGQCVVYELGTNDISANLIAQAEWNTLAALNELADADTVVALTLNTTGGDLRGWPFGYRTRHYNEFLRQLVADGTYPNLVLYDWEARSAGQLGWLVGPVPDGDVLHYNPSAPFPEALVDAGRMC